MNWTHRKFLDQLSNFPYVIPKLKFSSMTGTRRLYQRWRKKNHRWFCKRKAPETKACAGTLSAKRLSTLTLPNGKCEHCFITHKKKVSAVSYWHITYLFHIGEGLLSIRYYRISFVVQKNNRICPKYFQHTKNTHMLKKTREEKREPFDILKY